MKRDLESNIDAVLAFGPLTVSATGTGSSVDLRGYDSAIVVLSTGTMATGGTTTPSLTESVDGTTFTAVAAGDLSTAFTAVGTGLATAPQIVGYKGTCRYIKPVITVGGTGAGAIFSAVVVRGHPARSPL